MVRLPAFPKVYYGWIMLFAIALMTFASSGSRFSFQVFLIPMHEQLGWGVDQLALGASMNLILAGMMRPIVGVVADRMGSKVLVMVGVTLCGAALILTSLATELWQYYLAFGVLLAFGYACASPVTVTKLVSQWFVKRRSLAMSIGATGTALGELIVVPLAMATYLIVGWENAFRVIASFMLLVVLPVGFLLLYNRPADKGLQPFGYEPDATLRNRSLESISLTLKEALRGGDFWRLGLGFFVCGFTMSFASTHFVPFAMDMGIEPMAAANALGLVGACSLFGGLTAGYLGDRFSRKNVLATVYLFRGLAFVVLLQAHDLPTLYMGSFLLGISWTSTGPLTSAISADKFGLKNLGTIYGLMYTVMPIGSGVGAYLSGLVYELRHGYELTLIASAAAGLIAAVVVFTVGEPGRLGGARGERETAPAMPASLALEKGSV